MNIRRTTATLGVATLLAAPLALAAPAMATEKEFGVGGAQGNFEVEREHGGYKVSAKVQDAASGSKWRITLWHDGNRIFRGVRTADGDGDVREVSRQRPNTRGADVFRVKIKRVGGDSAVRRIRKP
jgi:hypothetical protein